MRLAGISKAGYYPAQPEAIEAIFPHILRGSSKQIAIADPCCGEGEALKQWADYLQCDPASVYGIELELGRADASKSLMPGSNILAPCSTFSAGCRNNSLGFIWCNPPFDTVTGGGMRQEVKFLHHVTPWLCMGGIMAFVCPESVAWSRPVVGHFLSHFTDVRVVPFPADYRPFNEVVTIGVRSTAEPSNSTWVSDVIQSKDYGMRCDPLVIPETRGPGASWRKVLPDAEELKKLIEASPLHEMLSPKSEQALASPPLELSKGHLALLLAAGVLDGVVRPHGEPPHVVRGTARKVKYVASSETDDDGNRTTIMRERIEMTVRVVDHTGKIKTLNSVDAVEEVKE